jgi:peptide/nickel transport system substrate-binding protein
VEGSVRNSDGEAAGGRLGRRQFLGIGGGLLGAGVLAACSSGASTRTAASGAGAKAGGTLRMANAGTAHQYVDAMLGILRGEEINAQMVYNGLTQRSSNFGVQMALAEEMTPNASATVWTVRLRSGVEFHDGKSLDADDVIYSFHRINDPSVEAIASSLFLPPLPKIVSMRKVDNLTVQITLDGPNTVLDELLAEAPTAPVYPANWNPAKPVGTGPFRVQSFVEGSQGVFTRFPNYWDGPALLDKVIAVEIADGTARLNALYSGQIDLALQPTPAQAPQVAQNGFKMLSLQTGTYPLITMNCAAGPFTDPRVRKALQLAIDRKQIMNTDFNGGGALGSDVPGYMDPYFDHSLVREQDVSQAKSLLSQAGFSSPITSVFRARDAALVQTIQQTIVPAGIKLNLVQVADSEYTSKQYTGLPLRFDSSPAFSFIYNALVFDTPGSFTWYSKFDDAPYLSLEGSYFKATSASQRKSIAQDMQQILFDRGPYLLPLFEDSLVAYSPKVGGLPTADPYGFGISGYDVAKMFIS